MILLWSIVRLMNCVSGRKQKRRKRKKKWTEDAPDQLVIYKQIVEETVLKVGVVLYVGVVSSHGDRWWTVQAMKRLGGSGGPS